MSLAFRSISIGEWARGTEDRLNASDLKEGTVLEMRSRIENTLDYEAAVFPSVMVRKIQRMGAQYAFIGQFLHQEGLEQSAISGDIRLERDPTVDNYLFPQNRYDSGGLYLPRLDKYVGRIGQSYFVEPELSTADLLAQPEDVLVEQRTQDPQPSLLRLPPSLVTIQL
jgi:hypothetical protein